MFNAAEAFLLGGGDEDSVAHEAGGGITVIRVKAED
jgi:hypothetical protein